MRKLSFVLLKAMTKVLAKVFVRSRNEYDLMDDFLAFYGYIFGFSNIIVIDNGSDDHRVHATYAKYAEKGVTIESDASGMTNHGHIMTDAMIRHRSSCEFLIPLDTDEFMFFPAAPSIATMQDARGVIHSHLESLPSEISIIRYMRFLGSVADPRSPDYRDFKHHRPAHAIREFYDQGWDKLIVRSSAFVSVSLGNHHAVVSGGTVAQSDTLGLLHFHETGSKRKRERCEMSMLGYEHMDVRSITDIDAQLRRCDEIIKWKTCGGHRVEQYRTYLRKQVLCREYMRLLSHLPHPLEATQLARDDALWLHDSHTISARILSKTSLRAPTHCAYSVDDVVYYEDTPDKPVEKIDQVRHLLQDLQSCP